MIPHRTSRKRAQKKNVSSFKLHLSIRLIEFQTNEPRHDPNVIRSIFTFRSQFEWLIGGQIGTMQTCRQEAYLWKRISNTYLISSSALFWVGTLHSALAEQRRRRRRPFSKSVRIDWKIYSQSNEICSASSVNLSIRIHCSFNCVGCRPLGVSQIKNAYAVHSSQGAIIISPFSMAVQMLFAVSYIIYFHLLSRRKSIWKCAIAIEIFICIIHIAYRNEFRDKLHRFAQLVRRISINNFFDTTIKSWFPSLNMHFELLYIAIDRNGRAHIWSAHGNRFLCFVLLLKIVHDQWEKFSPPKIYGHTFTLTLCHPTGRAQSQGKKSKWITLSAPGAQAQPQPIQRWKIDTKSFNYSDIEINMHR